MPAMPSSKAAPSQLHTLRARLSPQTWPMLAAVVVAMTLTLLARVGVFAADNAPQAIYLPVVSSPNKGNNGPISDQPSERLINLARQAGKLDAETALLYRVYASFEDPRLPAEYRGDDSTAPASMALQEAQARYSTLSAATQAALAPFWLPPTAENSWHEQREPGGQVSLRATGDAPDAGHAKVKWLTTCNSDPNIKVWYQERYPEDAATARIICEEVAGVIWPRLTSLMGRKPMDDGAYSAPASHSG